MSDPSRKSRRGRPKSKIVPMDRRLLRTHLGILRKHLGRIRRAGEHPNRELQFDDLFILQLCAFFNPTVRSLRTQEDLSQLPDMQELLDVERAARSTLSDANDAMDPDLLLPVIRDLQSRLPGLAHTDRELDRLLRRALLFDGSMFRVSARVDWALRKGRRGAKAPDHRKFVRLDLRLCPVRGIPEGAEINGKGTSETASLAENLEPDTLYIADRGIFSHELLRHLDRAQCQFVLRLKNWQKFTHERELPPTPEGTAGGVISDRIGRLAGSAAQQPAELEVRELLIKDPQTGGTIRLLTNLLDVDGSVIGDLYRSRWRIELFFRWLKVHAHFRHVYSESPNGLALAFYVAVIGTLLMYLQTGQKPSKYAYNMLCAVAAGQATLEDIAPILERRERERALERARLARKKAQQQQP